MTKGVPRIGDLVFTQAKHGGPFLVVAVYADQQTVDLRPVKPGKQMNFTDRGVPWSTLRFADEEDASQVAARIVKEATEQ